MDNQEAIDVMFNEWKCLNRNDGINCDRKCESCDLVMDVQTIREAFNMAISALQAQEAKTQLSREDTTSDLISRQAAIDTVESFDILDGYTDQQELIYRIRQLPSAQPTGTPLHDSGTDYAHGYTDGYKQGRKDAQPEIIRCRDCKYWRELKYAKETKRYIPLCGFNAIYTKADDFCSKAERRTDD